MWSLRRSKTVRARQSPRQRYRPLYDLLEDRIDPAAFYHVADVTDLQNAIVDVNNNPTQQATIELAPATYDLTSKLQIKNASNLTIEGNSADQVVIDNPKHSDRIFDIEGGNVTISGLTITGGAAPMGGGVLIASGANVTITNSAVTGNTAQGAPGVDGRGGGIYEASGATLALDTTSVVGNQAVGGGANTASGGLGGAGEGGGLFTEAGSTATITDSQFLNNLALGGAGTYGGHGGGGGINDHGQLTITGTTIADNHSVGGNGVFAGVAIAAGVLNENEAAASGATGPGAMLTLASSTLKGNVATGGASLKIGGGAFGAGLMNLGGTLTVTGTTITGNSAVVGPGPLNSPLLGYYLALTAGLGALGQFNTLPLTQVDVLARGFSVAGGLMSLGGTASLDHTTIAGNHALIGLVANVLILP